MANMATVATSGATSAPTGPGWNVGANRLNGIEPTVVLIFILRTVIVLLAARSWTREARWFPDLISGSPCKLPLHRSVAPESAWGRALPRPSRRSIVYWVRTWKSIIEAGFRLGMLMLKAPTSPSRGMSPWTPISCLIPWQTAWCAVATVANKSRPCRIDIDHGIILWLSAASSRRISFMSAWWPVLSFLAEKGGSLGVHGRLLSWYRWLRWGSRMFTGWLKSPATTCVPMGPLPFVATMAWGQQLGAIRIA